MLVAGDGSAMFPPLHNPYQNHSCIYPMKLLNKGGGEKGCVKTKMVFRVGIKL